MDLSILIDSDRNGAGKERCTILQAYISSISAAEFLLGKGLAYLLIAITSNHIFNLEPILTSERELSDQVKEGKLDVGIIIPRDFPQQLAKEAASIQIFIDRVNANTAGIANNYIHQIIQQYNRLLANNQTSILVLPQFVFLYNPGLTSSWSHLAN